MMVSVPERPSTPSEQFVTLIDTQTKMTVSIPNTTGGIFTEPPNMAKVIVLELKCRYTTATTIATAKSSAPCAGPVTRKSTRPMAFQPHRQSSL